MLALLVKLVPPGLMTVMSVVAAKPAGETAVIWVSLLMVKSVALVAPNFTAVALEKLLPDMTTDVPPSVVPEVGDIALTVGGRT